MNEKMNSSPTLVSEMTYAEFESARKSIPEGRPRICYFNFGESYPKLVEILSVIKSYGLEGNYNDSLRGITIFVENSNDFDMLQKFIAEHGYKVILPNYN